MGYERRIPFGFAATPFDAFSVPSVNSLRSNRTAGELAFSQGVSYAKLQMNLLIINHSPPRRRDRKGAAHPCRENWKEAAHPCRRNHKKGYKKGVPLSNRHSRLSAVLLGVALELLSEIKKIFYRNI